MIFCLNNMIVLWGYGFVISDVKSKNSIIIDEYFISQPPLGLWITAQLI